MAYRRPTVEVALSLMVTNENRHISLTRPTDRAREARDEKRGKKKQQKAHLAISHSTPEQPGIKATPNSTSSIIIRSYAQVSFQ